MPKVIIGAGGAAWWILQGFERTQIQIEAFIVSSEEKFRLSSGLPVLDPTNWEKLAKKI